MSAAERNGTLGLAGAPLPLCSKPGCTQTARSRWQSLCREHHREYQAQWRKDNNSGNVREELTTLAHGHVALKVRVNQLEAELATVRAQLAILASR